MSDTYPYPNQYPEDPTGGADLPTASGGGSGGASGGGKAGGGTAGDGSGRFWTFLVLFALVAVTAGFLGYEARDRQLRTGLSVRFSVPGNASVGQCGIVHAGDNTYEACATEHADDKTMPAELTVQVTPDPIIVQEPPVVLRGPVADCPTPPPTPAPIPSPPPQADRPAQVEPPKATPTPPARVHQRPRRKPRHSHKARCCEPCWNDDWWKQEPKI